MPVDRAIFFAVAGRTWQGLAGVLSLWIIARSFSLQIQGAYSIFINLLAIQSFFDLGLTSVLVYVASHEWNSAQGDDAAAAVARQRLGELLLRTRRWYAWCAAGFVVVANGIGWWYFRDAEFSSIDWEGPWVAAVVITAGSLWLSPWIVILEGCNYVAEVNALRLVQAMAGNLVVWSVMLSGGELWAVAASAAVRLAAEAYMIAVHFRPFLDRMRVAVGSGPGTFSWSAELLPLQWRIGVTSIAAYFLWTAYTPIVAKYHGLEVAGRMGMTMTAVSTIQMIALAWIQTRVPRIGALLARGERREAQSLFRRMFTVCMGVYVLGSIAFLGLVLLLERWKPLLADRVLAPADIVLFEIGLGLTLFISGLGTYVRAHKIDPFLGVGLLNAAVTGTLVWYFGKEMGPRGAALAHTGVTIAIMLPATIYLYRNVVRRSST
jgi:O-antigen/teichoic acid export membrane protein